MRNEREKVEGAAGGKVRVGWGRGDAGRRWDSETQGPSRSTGVRLGANTVLLVCWMAKVGAGEVKNTS